MVFDYIQSATLFLFTISSVAGLIAARPGKSRKPMPEGGAFTMYVVFLFIIGAISAVTAVEVLP